LWVIALVTAEAVFPFYGMKKTQSIFPHGSQAVITFAMHDSPCFFLIPSIALGMFIGLCLVA
jgi:hypothetical protein